MDGHNKDNFSFLGSSLNDISLYWKQKKAWIHSRKVLDSLCSRSFIVPFREKTKILYSKLTSMANFSLIVLSKIISYLTDLDVLNLSFFFIFKMIHKIGMMVSSIVITILWICRTYGLHVSFSYGISGPVLSARQSVITVIYH